MAMKMEDLIREAQASGLNVQYTKTRENGWTRIRVTMVGSVTYKKSEGNTALRAKMGKQLSKAERQARYEANFSDSPNAAAQGAQRARHGVKKGTRLPKLTKTERNAIAKNNRMVKKTGKGSKMGYSAARKLKAMKGHRGIMDQARRHYLDSLGLAYPQFIEQFILYLEGEESFDPKISLHDVIAYLEGFVRRRKSGTIAINPRKALKHDELQRAWKAFYGYHESEAAEQKMTHDKGFELIKAARVSLS